MTSRQDRIETVEQILYGSTLPTRAAKAYAARIVEALDNVILVMEAYNKLSDEQKAMVEDVCNLHRP